MRYFFRLIFLMSLSIPPVLASDAYPGGLWTKIDHPDPQNISIFYVDKKDVKAIGYGQIEGKPALWHAEGSLHDGIIELTYRYSSEATPSGWAAQGTMQLKVSNKADKMYGVARSLSGDWTDTIEFKRIFVGSLQAIMPQKWDTW